MAKIEKLVSAAPSLSENLSELRNVLVESGDYLTLILDEISIYDESEHYRDRPEEAIKLMAEELKGALEDLSALMVNEASKLDPEEKEVVKAVISGIIKNLVQSRPVSLVYLSKVLLNYGEVPKKRIQTEEISIRNILLDYNGKRDFLLACGLTEDTEGGSGSHTKWTDRSGEMQGSHVISRHQAWLRSEIKQLREVKLPEERIKSALSACSIDFTTKIDFNEE